MLARYPNITELEVSNRQPSCQTRLGFALWPTDEEEVSSLPCHINPAFIKLHIIRISLQYKPRYFAQREDMEQLHITPKGISHFRGILSSFPRSVYRERHLRVQAPEQ